MVALLQAAVGVLATHPGDDVRSGVDSLRPAFVPSPSIVPAPHASVPGAADVPDPFVPSMVMNGDDDHGNDAPVRPSRTGGPSVFAHSSTSTSARSFASAGSSGSDGSSRATARSLSVSVAG